MPRQLLVESIRIDGETQSRVRINEETVDEYADAMKTPTDGNRAPGARQAWPALLVFFDGKEYWLADGFHRLRAAQQIGRKNIMAEVKQGSRTDAAWASCAANQKHGLRRTNADKRKAVQIALKLRPGMADRLLAEHVGIDHKTVKVERERMVSGGEIPHLTTRIGADGKEYTLPTTSAQTEAGHGLGPPPGPDERPGAQGASAGSEPEQPSEPPPPSPTADEDGRKPERPARSTGSGQVDDVGRRVPEELLPLWKRRQEVQDMLTALSRIRVTLEKAQENRDPLFSEVPFSSASLHLDQAYNSVQVAKPYAVCAFCQGHGCKACAQRGLLGKFRWDTCVPREHKEAVARLIEKERGE